MAEPARIETHSDTWRAVVAHAKSKIETARKHIEARGVDERDADFARGQIAALRAILNMGEAKPSTAATAEPYEFAGY